MTAVVRRLAAARGRRGRDFDRHVSSALTVVRSDAAPVVDLAQARRRKAGRRAADNPVDNFRFGPRATRISKGKS